MGGRREGGTRAQRIRIENPAGLAELLREIRDQDFEGSVQRVVNHMDGEVEEGVPRASELPRYRTSSWQLRKDLLAGKRMTLADGALAREVTLWGGVTGLQAVSRTQFRRLLRDEVRTIERSQELWLRSLCRLGRPAGVPLTATRLRVETQRLRRLAEYLGSEPRPTLQEVDLPSPARWRGDAGVSDEAQSAASRDIVNREQAKPAGSGRDRPVAHLGPKVTGAPVTKAKTPEEVCREEKERRRARSPKASMP